MKRTLPKITEAEFQSQIIALAKLCGWRIMHQRPARTNRGWRTAIEGHAGFPDLVMIRHSRVRGLGKLLALECKSETGEPTDEQMEWLSFFASVPGCVAQVVRPSDWDWIESQLKGA